MREIVSGAATRFDAIFVSDVHLSPETPRTCAAFLRFLEELVPSTRRLFILGDLFEVWIGDDVLDDTEDAAWLQPIVQALRVAGQTTQAFFMHGNRDFLMGQRFADTCSFTLLADPTLVTIGTQALLLAHGDAFCTDDTAYLAYRAQMRDPQWQAQLLKQSLTERRKLARALRSESEEAKSAKSTIMMDANPEEVERVMRAYGAPVCIHGHTHRPAHHRHATGERWVLPDWDFDHAPEPRGGYLALTGNVLSAIRYRPS